MVGPTVAKSLVATWWGLSAVLMSACGRAPSGEVGSMIPTDATGVVSVDLGAVLAWDPVQRAQTRLLGTDLSALLAAAQPCSTSLSTGRVTVAWSASAVTVGITAAGVGAASTLRCLATSSALAGTGLRIEPDADPATVSFAVTSSASVSAVARGLDDSRLLLHVPRIEDASPVADDALGIDGDAPLAAALGRVDTSRPLWAAVVGALPGIDDVAVDVALQDAAAEVHVRARGEDVTSEIMRDGLGQALAAVYLPHSIAARAEIERADETTTEARMDVSTSEVYALDVRWVDVPSRAVAAKETLTPDALALLDDWAGASSTQMSVAAVPVKNDLLLGQFEPLGIAACDDYVRKFDTCIVDTMPAEAQESARQALAKSIDAWRQAAKVSGATDVLDQTCKRAQEAIATMCA